MNPLQEISEFKTSPELIAKLYEFGIQKNYAAGSIILNENAHIRSIPIVTKGVMKVIRLEDDGREILLYYIKAGESCIMSFLGGLHIETSKVKAEVEEDAEILFLPAHALDNNQFWYRNRPWQLKYFKCIVNIISYFEEIYKTSHRHNIPNFF